MSSAKRGQLHLPAVVPCLRVPLLAPLLSQEAARDCAVPWDKVKPNALPDYLIEDNFRYLVEIEGSFCCLAAGVRNMCFCAICLIPWTLLLL